MVVLSMASCMISKAVGKLHRLLGQVRWLAASLVAGQQWQQTLSTSCHLAVLTIVATFCHPDTYKWDLDRHHPRRPSHVSMFSSVDKSIRVTDCAIISKLISINQSNQIYIAPYVASESEAHVGGARRIRPILRLIYCLWYYCPIDVLTFLFALTIFFVLGNMLVVVLNPLCPVRLSLLLYCIYFCFSDPNKTISISSISICRKRIRGACWRS